MCIRDRDYVYENVGPYRKKMEEKGVVPGDIRTLADITKLPFITKEDLANNYPNGLFAADMEDIVRIHASSGTTGKPKIAGYKMCIRDRPNCTPLRKK